MPKTFVKEIVKPGTYKVDGHEVVITKDRIDHWAKQHSAMVAAGLHVPAPYDHDQNAVPIRAVGKPTDANSKNNAGFWSKLWVDDKGTLVGELTGATPQDDEAIGAKAKGVSLLAKEAWTEGGKDWSDVITHVCLTNKPVAHGTAGFVALSLDSLVCAADSSLPTGGQQPGRTTTLDSALAILAELGLELPADTTPENLIERLVVAGTAVKSHKKVQEGGGQDQEPEGSKVQQPSPVAMSHDLEFAAKLMADGGITNPETKKAFTAEELKAAAAKDKAAANIAMSAEDQALVNASRKHFREDYKRRVDALVAKGLVSKKDATDKWLPQVESAEIRFSNDGSRVPNPLDAVLEAMEALPKGLALTGHNVSSLRSTTKGMKLSGDAFQVQDPPNEGNRPLTEKEVDELVESQLSAVGMA